MRFATDADRWLVITALQAMADRWTLDADALADDAKGNPGFASLVRQMRDQTDAARRIAAQIEEEG